MLDLEDKGSFDFIIIFAFLLITGRYYPNIFWIYISYLIAFQNVGGICRWEKRQIK